MKNNEAKIQSTCVMWLWNEHTETRGLFFAVTNNSEHAARGTMRKALGLVPGVADCLFLWKGKIYAFEFKTEDGKQSERQKWWEAILKSDGGGKYFIVRDFDTFKKIVENILSNTLPIQRVIKSVCEYGMNPDDCIRKADTCFKCLKDS